MEKRIKQSVGIDCAQNELVVAYGAMDENYDVKILSNTKFSNNEKGFEKLLAWSRKLNPQEREVTYLIEATGVRQTYEGVLSSPLFVSQDTKNPIN